MTHSFQQQQKKQNLTSFHSKPPVTLNGGHQRRLALCLRTSRLSGWTPLEIPNRWNVSEQRWTQAKTVPRRWKTTRAVCCSAEDGNLLEKPIDAVCFWLWRAVRRWSHGPAYVSCPNLGCCIFLCHCKCMPEAERGSRTVFSNSTGLSLWHVLYCDMPILRRAETKESICTVCVCGACVGPPWWTCLIIVQVLYMHSIVYDH